MKGSTAATAYEMEEWKKRDGDDVEGGAAVDDDDTLLPEHEFDTGSVSDDDEDEYEMNDGEGVGRGRSRGIKGILWVALCTMATLAGRRMLTGDFRKF
jgi:hypothetical protein